MTITRHQTCEAFRAFSGTDFKVETRNPPPGVTASVVVSAAGGERGVGLVIGVSSPLSSISIVVFPIPLNRHTRTKSGGAMAM